MSRNIIRGVKYGFRIHQKSYGTGFYGTLTRKSLHTYGAHTRLGKRTVWREFATVPVEGVFNSRKEAADRCKMEIEARIMADCIKNPDNRTHK